MDAIFGKNNFRNEITWRRHTSGHGNQHGAKQWGRVSDTLLYYAGKDAEIVPYKELTEKEEKKKFPLVDEHGWRYYDDSAHIWSSPSMGERPNLCYEWRGFHNPHPSGWRLKKEQLEAEYQKGNFVILPSGRLQRRKYPKDYRGETIGTIWTDIKPASGKERTGYPTQKPLALLERIINASSNEGDVVLDPFCGCATTCIAAERLNRQWIGIDKEVKARDLVVERLEREVDKENLLKAGGGRMPQIIHKRCPPARTDSDAPRRSKNIRAILYKKQGGHCAGHCGSDGRGRRLDMDLLHVDHKYPRSKGGSDVDENLQLLCPTCNSRKGNRAMEYLYERTLEMNRYQTV